MTDKSYFCRWFYKQDKQSRNKQKTMDSENGKDNNDENDRLKLNENKKKNLVI